jgi:hypothetical protein
VDNVNKKKLIKEIEMNKAKAEEETAKDTEIRNENAIAGVINHSVLGATSNDTNVNMCINNWLGFLGSCSTPCIDTSDFSDIFIEFAFFENVFKDRVSFTSFSFFFCSSNTVIEFFESKRICSIKSRSLCYLKTVLLTVKFSSPDPADTSVCRCAPMALRWSCPTSNPS